MNQVQVRMKIKEKKKPMKINLYECRCFERCSHCLCLYLSWLSFFSFFLKHLRTQLKRELGHTYAYQHERTFLYRPPAHYRLLRNAINTVYADDEETMIVNPSSRTLSIKGVSNTSIYKFIIINTRICIFIRARLIIGCTCVFLFFLAG